MRRQKTNEANETENQLKLTKEMLEQNSKSGGRVDQSMALVIDNNLACTKFLMQKYIETLNILKINYNMIKTWQNSDQYAIL